MKKKVVDILPPEKPSGIIQKIKKPSLERRSEPERPIKIEAIPRRETTNKKKILLYVLPLPVLLISVFLIGFFVSKVEIKIWPETEILNFQTQLTVDSEASIIIDATKKIIPGEIKEVTKTITDVFSATGESSKKARGTIRLYNSYTTKTENWLAGTRFVSEEGKLFKSENRIQVPGAEIKDGKLEASYVDVPVVAVEEGPEYNIGSSHFSIYVFRGTARYTKYYGESFNPMTGGGQSTSVTEQDLLNAKNSVTDRLKSESKTALMNDIKGDSVFLDDVLEIEIVEEFSLANEGYEAGQFTYSIKGSAKTIIFKKEHSESIVKELLKPQTKENQLVYEDSLEIIYTPEVVDIEAGKFVVNADISVKTYPKLDLIVLKKGLMGKTLQETSILIKNQSDIMKTDVRFWPFWIKTVPEDLDKIRIEYPIIDQG
jgi:hypothetical protein